MKLENLWDHILRIVALYACKINV